MLIRLCTVVFRLNNFKEVTMKKITNVLSGMKNIFCQKNNNYNDKSVRCVELKDAARRTCGRTGQNAENTGGQIFYYQWQK